MFESLLKNLLRPEAENLGPKDERIAIAALFVRVARSDDKYETSEIEKIERVLATRYNLGQDAARELRKEGEELEVEAPDTVRFTRAIKDAVAYEERMCVIESLWQIALADGERDPEEDSLLRLVSSLLGISDFESAAARKRILSSSK